MESYQKISDEILKTLPERSRGILIQRFGLFGEERATLEVIGRRSEVTRERVRQIEKDALRKLQKREKELADVCGYFSKKLDNFGGLKKEGLLISDLSGGDKGNHNYIVFLLNVAGNFLKFPENKKCYAFWAIDKSVLKKAEATIEEAVNFLNKKKRLVSLMEIIKEVSQESNAQFFLSSIEISKKISINESGLYGLSKWPEINPRGIKDRAYIIFKKVKKPLHFKEVASLVGENTNPQTTHNELIKDSRFVLVGRGVYALSEWGYVPGEVKEVIRNILKEKGALHKREIIVRVSEQRIVKENTIIQNLSNKKHFIRTPDGKYTIA